MTPASSEPGNRRCEAVRTWLAGRPLRDNPQMAARASTLSWDEWVVQGRANADTEPCLLEFLDAEEDPVSRSEIALALGYVGSGHAVARLLNDHEPIVVMEAAAALGRIGNRDAIPQLIEALAHTDPNVRANACQALGALGGAQATGALTHALDDPDPFVRSAAHSALSRSQS